MNANKRKPRKKRLKFKISSILPQNYFCYLNIPVYLTLNLRLIKLKFNLITVLEILTLF